MERDSKRVVREWNWEIEAEMCRLAAKQDCGRWRLVVWTVLEAIWLVGLFTVIGLFARLQ
jgi:hypothetical protein